MTHDPDRANWMTGFVTVKPPRKPVVETPPVFSRGDVPMREKREKFVAPDRGEGVRLW